jgi:hypothetical protein
VMVLSANLTKMISMAIIRFVPRRYRKAQATSSAEEKMPQAFLGGLRSTQKRS